MSYKYIISLWEEKESKWWTYVEGIFWPTSYLPFLSSDEQSTFYQWLLFNACTKIVMKEYGAVFEDALCSVKTNNNQQFIVEMHTGYVWSDWTPLTIDDIYFTYKNIIIDNQRWIQTLNNYGDIRIEKISDKTLKIDFNKRSIDNKLFFSYFILPRHSLIWTDFDYYKTVFSQNPIYTNCAQIKPQSNDINSLVFDVNKCQDNKLWFYQIKNLHNFDAFKQDYNINNKSIIDVYQWEEWLQGYIAQTIVTNAYTTIFFNTNSDKMRIRLRRSLAWLINNHFYTEGYEKFIRKDQRIFDNFMSTGQNIEDFLTRITPDGTISIAELQESWVKNLTGRTITFNEKQRRHAYYINGKPFSIEIDITTAGSYDMLGIKYGETDKWNINTYNKKEKTAKYTIGLKDIQSWINTYTIYTKDKDKKVINIGSITLYLLDNKSNTEQTQWVPETTITIIYQNTASTQKVVQHLRDIFTKMNIEKFFVFLPLSDKYQMEEELQQNNYDIAILPIERWLKRDLSPILKTDDAIINPSQYTNQQFTNLFEQYIQFDQDNKTIRDQILAIYTRDIPFIILGKQIKNIYVKPDIYEQIFLMYTGTIFENNRREIIYTQLVRARNMHIDREAIWWIRSLRKFIVETVNNKKDTDDIQENSYEQIR
jgi:hypothetical protein